MLANLINYCFANHCLLCKAISKNDIALCEDCKDTLPLIKQACARCGIPLPVESLLCGQCQMHPPCFDNVLSPFHYKNPMSYLIKRFKFNEQLACTKVLAALLLEQILDSELIDIPDIIIPVPLHRRRMSQRGFNQAYEIAKPIAKRLNIPLAPFTSTRVKNTLAQSQMPAKKRRENIKNAFAVNPLSGHVVIVDDVITTGHTVNELAKECRRAGASRVDVWSLCRA